MRRINCIIGLAAFSFAANAWSQSAWPSYPNNGALAVSGNGSVGIGTNNPSGSFGWGLPVGTAPSLDLVSTANANATHLRLISAPTIAGHFTSGFVFRPHDTP